MDADLDTLATALYVRTDDLLKASPERVPWRPKVGITPKITDAELITLAVMQALLGHTSEARWLRHARSHLRELFPYLPKQPGYNKRLRRLGPTIGWLVGVLARDTTLWTDDVWVADSTPVELMALAGSAQRCLSKLLSSGRGEAARVGGSGQALGPLTRRGCWSSVDHVPPDITR